MVACASQLPYCYSQAKDMVGLVNKFAATIEEKKGSLSEDEVCRPEMDSSPECE